jgi:hypothetical protein
MFMEELKEPGEKIEVSEYKGERLIGRGVAKEVADEQSRSKSRK